MLKATSRDRLTLWGHLMRRKRLGPRVGLFERFLWWAISFLGLHARVIRRPSDGRAYLLRVYLCRHRHNEGRGLYLHYFFRGDSEKELHNHPWYTARSLILTGGYTEEIAHGPPYKVTRVFRRPGRFNRIFRDTYHKVALTHGPCWTLFYAGRRVDRIRGKDWSFLDVESGERTHAAVYFDRQALAATRRHNRIRLSPDESENLAKALSEPRRPKYLRTAAQGDHEPFPLVRRVQ